MPEPQHRDRLSVQDNSFLELEREGASMHIGSVMTFEGPPLRYDALLDHIDSRLHLVPRYRQKVFHPPLQSGRPMWVDDTSFRLDYHVRHTALPKPGSDEQLRHLCSRIFSQRLDRDRPLWEMWLVEGLAGNRLGVISKTHHALIDGLSGVDLISLLFDVTPVPREVEQPERSWTPQLPPSVVGLAAAGVRDVAQTPLRAGRRGVDSALHPRRTTGEAVESARGVWDILVEPMLTPAPATPFNVEIGPHRRVHWAHADLEEFKEIKRTLGGTVNDVVLAVVAGALRRWLLARSVSVDGLELRALVPVSVRSASEKGGLGNRVAAMRGPLPVYVGDPVERLRLVREAMNGLKESKQAVGAEVLVNVQEFAPPGLLAQAARLNFSTRLFNLVVTNVPGPQVPVYLLGRELERLVPLAFLAENHALAIAIMSYHGRLDFGLLGDLDVLADVDELARYLGEARVELLETARAAASRPTGRGRTAPVQA